MQSELVPAPAGLAVLAVLGAAAVLVLPAAGSALPWEIDPEPNATQLALTSYVLVLLTAGYLWLVARAAGWRRAPALLTLGYLAGIALVKFVVSPASFHNSTDTTLAAFVWLGMGVMALYLGALAVVYRAARRAPTWVLVAGVLVFAFAGRYAVALLLGRDAGDYLADIFGGAGWWLLALLGASVVAAVESFRADEAASSFRAGAAVIVVYHGLWALFMVRLFG